jgi:hypothetical protein
VPLTPSCMRPGAHQTAVRGVAPLPGSPPECTPPWWRSRMKDAIAGMQIKVPPSRGFGLRAPLRSSRRVDPGTAATATVVQDGRSGAEAAAIVEDHYSPAHVISRLPAGSRSTAPRVASATRALRRVGPCSATFSSRPCNGQSAALSSQKLLVRKAEGRKRMN